ncbi:hypothetical protein MMC12_000624 [Toensbergia leucococca]|nr:hypothetical protein [Toensbergia leucococca]
MATLSHPPSPSPQTPIIIYLPRGPLPLTPQIQSNRLYTLSLSANATIVYLNYRLSPHHPYPTPIHDVLAGYDWIIKHLAHSRTTSHLSPAKIGVCGELIGGSLASMLALTECHAHKAGVSAAAVINPITDWTALEDLGPATTIHLAGVPPSKPEHASLPSLTSLSPNAHSLLSLRKTLFLTPSAYFDPFASPLLFFRTPSTEIPPPPSPSSDPSPSIPTKKRRSHRRHPPLNSGLRLPSMRVEVVRESVLRGQGEEFAELLGRSVGVYGGGGGYGDFGAGGGEEGRVNLMMREEVGEEEWEEVGIWLGGVLRF